MKKMDTSAYDNGMPLINFYLTILIYEYFQYNNYDYYKFRKFNLQNRWERVLLNLITSQTIQMILFSR